MSTGSRIRCGIPPKRIARTRPVDSRTSVQVSISVVARMTEGTTTPDELLVWVEEAVAYYHSWRAGFVSIAASSKIDTPKVSRWPEEL